jgi:hypothetical protein
VSALGSEGKVEDQASLGRWGGIVACAYLLGIGGLVYGAEVGGCGMADLAVGGLKMPGLNCFGGRGMWRRLCNFKHKK